MPESGAGERSAGLDVSIHDLMPQTLESVLRLLDLLEDHGVRPVTLLVVPGLPWQDEQLAVLKDLERRGHRLAGHGWLHRVEKIRGLKHTLHSLVLSRRVAEHLALDGDGVCELMARCHRWFGEQDLTPPERYVPPAWAMGSVGRAGLRSLPFRYFETLGGMYDSTADRFQTLPLLGYEADTGFRAAVLRQWNGVNRQLIRRLGRGRIGIHPFDLDLKLGTDLRRDIAQLAAGSASP